MLGYQRYFLVYLPETIPSNATLSVYNAPEQWILDPLRGSLQKEQVETRAREIREQNAHLPAERYQVREAPQRSMLIEALYQEFQLDPTAKKWI